jgi:hypothetical protein
MFSHPETNPPCLERTARAMRLLIGAAEVYHGTLRT